MGMKHLRAYVNEYWIKMIRYPIRIQRLIAKSRYHKGYYSDKIHVLDWEETLLKLSQGRYSFLRFGDGEIALMRGDGIPFQEYQQDLGNRLCKLANCEDESILVGMPRCYFYNDYKLMPIVQQFVYAMIEQRKFLLKICNKEKQYIDTSLTQAYQTYDEIDYSRLYDVMNSFLVARDITVICGKGIFDKLQYNILNKCKSVRYIYGPSKNAYSQYSEIMEVAKKEDKSRLICIVLGPTAKPLVYDLHKVGYQAWDMGHYFKDYDAYCRKQSRSEREIAEFFKPD